MFSFLILKTLIFCRIFPGDSKCLTQHLKLHEINICSYGYTQTNIYALIRTRILRRKSSINLLNGEIAHYFNVRHIQML